MRELFDLIDPDLDLNGTRFVRPSVRGIIIKDNRIAAVHSMMYDYYKFPGGGKDQGEDDISTLIREVKEEAGRDVIVSSVREYGRVYRLEKGAVADIFEQENLYYLCNSSNTSGEQDLDDYEFQENFTLEWITPDEFYSVNMRFVNSVDGSDDLALISKRAEAVRDGRVAKMLADEGFIADNCIL